ncbi:MAG: DUF262 domain-containing protein [Candidatus Limisoma sp.]
MNEIQTTPIGQLILNKETPSRPNRVEHYLIPSYQRGYRWTRLHVLALLEDIDAFLQKQSVGATIQSYCLQPIVVVEQEDAEGKRIWEIIDGQQRLTTLYIILKRLGLPHYQIFFDKRNKSTDFLRNLSSNTLCDDNPDFHFMSDAYRCIDNWFNNKMEDDISYAKNFAVQLLKNVQVIWYHVKLITNTASEQESEKINIFNRLNIGKIPLEDAELVRALLMSRVDGQTEHEKLMRQAEFSNEWYEIEHWLKQNEVWRFLTNNNYANHIQLIFELIARNKNSENYSTYKWFEQQVRNSDNNIEKAKELWDKVKQVFSKLRYWYKDRDLYHFIGFLLSTNIVKLDEILDHSESALDKKTFYKWTVSQVLNFLNSVDLQKLSYDNNHKELTDILLLFNVLSVLQLKANSQNRFPFNLYNEIKKGERWSLEHIHAQRSQDPLKRKDVIKSWIDDTLASIEHVNNIEKPCENDPDNRSRLRNVDLTNLKDQLHEMSQKSDIDIDEFNSLKDKIIEAFESESTKHELENMALLSTSDNASLNNAIFPVKRDRIIKMEREGKFIPPCTRNVFLKIYSKADSQPYFWSYEDKQNYVNEINNVFNKFKNEYGN